MSILKTSRDSPMPGIFFAAIPLLRCSVSFCVLSCPKSVPAAARPCTRGSSRRKLAASSSLHFVTYICYAYLLGTFCLCSV
ncbi:hypothetical protein CABS01_03478 [Colletotrichum abscissum]|uniref:uncharacterized protein n=1 Tax=Colletotrichum abscissum TaxID=1671311 RepID=UPI0027D62323|nr:uncharacterized protein CABS01_03478 [Colletotrichum abscissum]KAK1478176.1 hypothetical protein CABS01_03478 [Colletotrichum abscissum]